MKKTIFKQLLTCKSRGFTLIEALISAFVVTSVVLGPLTVALDATAHARLTKDTMIATYLAQEGIELLRGQQDSIYMKCLDSTGTFCVFQNTETPSEAAWRMFRERLGANAEGVSCYDADNQRGCAYDFIDMTGDQSVNPPKSVSTETACNTLSLGPDSIYVCTGSHGSGPGFSYKKFSRVIHIKSLDTFIGSDSNYNDDLRVISTVTFRRPSGFTRDIVFVDFLHSRS